MAKKVLIVGGVAGGASAAARLRRLDETAEIILFERGEYISYANCGLPYHVGGVIKSRDALLLQTPEAMRIKFNMEVRIRSEVQAIDRAAKQIQVKNLATGETYTESYDVLILSTGSSPLKPNIPGINVPRIYSLWTVPDTDRINNLIHDQNIQNAVVIGGGFIGVEMAENLRHRGLDVTIVEMMDQVLTQLDYEMAQLIHEGLEKNGVKLCLGDGVSAFEEAADHVVVKLSSGKEIATQMVVLAIGVRPNNELAKAAGLELNARGGVVVDAQLRTSDPAIYAVGDVIEVEDFIDKTRTMIPLAGPANKQGRIAADNIAGADEAYGGTQGSSIVQVFDLAAGCTGQNEKTLIRKGLVYGQDYERITVTQNSHAGYYPGALPLTMKLLFSLDGKKIYGAQIVGRDGVDKRIDTIGVAIRLGGSVLDLKSLEFAYAPPFSSAKDPVNMAGFVAENVLTGKTAFAEWNVVEKTPAGEKIFLDVREDAERAVSAVPGSVHIPLGQLRSRLGELDSAKEIVVLCAIGVRAYNASRILAGHGFEHVKIYPGGMRFYVSTHYHDFEDETPQPETVADSGHAESAFKPHASFRVDCSGLQCPGPIMKVFETMKTMNDGDIIEVSASDPGFARDIVAWTRRTGNTLLENEKRGDDYVALLKKGKETAPAPSALAAVPNGKTIIVFSGDLDRVIASFIIANGAAAMGRQVTMFFTFWGLNVLRKAEPVPVKKSLIESMFGRMMPRGVDKLTLSRMNMGGMGSMMIKKVMQDKNVDSLAALIEKAKQAGVKLIACTMSMDIMGIKEEELIDGVELGGVGAYLGDAEESDVNLFI